MQSETKYKYTYGIMHSRQIVMRKKQQGLAGVNEITRRPGRTLC